MKNKKIVSLLSLVGLLFLVANGAWAYNYNDNTQIEAFYHTTASGAWTNGTIGYPTIFDTAGANLSGSLFTIFTNWNPGKDGTLSASNLPGGILTADLFIYNTNGPVYAIRLDTLTGQGEVFTNPSFETSQDRLKGSDLTYGGLYDNQGTPSLVPVRATSGGSGLTPVTWTYGTWSVVPYGYDYVGNQVTIDLTGLVGNNWSFVWGTGTCGNDTFAGNVAVPEPSILLFLGAGLIGLGGLRRKFKS